MKRVYLRNMKLMLEDWNEGTLPRHFQKGASQRYGYETRTPKYQNRKNSLGIGPLQYTGRSMRKILSQRPEPTGNSVARVTLRLKATGPFGRRYTRKKSGMPPWKHKMKDEVATMLQGEVNELAARMQDRIARDMDDKTFQKVTQYRG